MVKKLLKTQLFVAIFGTIFAYTSVFFDFLRFYNIENTIFKVKDCVIPNPVLTPCFWGAFAFLLSIFISFKLIKNYQTKTQKGFIIYLLGCNAFAWSNFALEINKFLQAGGKQYIGCSGQTVSNPFLTPCFGGSFIFLLLIIVAIITLNTSRKEQPQQ